MATNKDKTVSILMVGIGGYGYCYLTSLLQECEVDQIQIVGVVDPIARQSPGYDELKRLHIPICPQISEFYADGRMADLAIIASPIQYHYLQTRIALKHGTYVLCEKPVSALVQEVDQLIKIRDDSNKWVMVGYQWSYSKAIQDLKKDIRAGLFGRPVRLKTLCFWPRGDAYYQRNNWAGKMIDSNDAWILDSPVNNAMAHFLHNLLYVLGEDTHLSAIPETVVAEIYRANPIENYDTAACRIYTDQGTELLFYASHATLGTKDAIFNFQFENAVISFNEFSGEIIAIDKNGKEKSYGSPDDDHHFLKLFEAIETVRNPKPIVCGLEAARSQTLCMNAIQNAVSEIKPFPKSLVQRDELKKRFWVNGLDSALCDCYHNNELPHEAGCTWAKRNETFQIKKDFQFIV
ncbi:Gfo/Idh/MocA family oxidoreductase [candidate division KSB1 bacterium]|nr:Gfo/Idh/MocA family oxidoreductase [candidate division KSB1 bacterium]